MVGEPEAFMKNREDLEGEQQISLAEHQRKMFAREVFPIYKGTAYFLDGASLREYQKLRANNLIQWHIT